MNIYKKIVLLGFVLLASSLFAKEIGTMSLFTFKNSQALKNTEVIVDDTQSVRTDEDGYLQMFLEVGRHQVEIFAKDEKGYNLGYIKKFVNIKKDKDTQVSATFTSGDDFINIDTPMDGRNIIDIKSFGEGLFEGVVLSSQNNKPIANARIFVKGTDIDTKTDQEGKFSITIPASAKLTISVIHSEYSSLTIDDIFVKKGATLQRDISLSPSSMELDEFVVLAPKVQGSMTSIIAEEKESTSISNILSAEEMSKKGDSSAAAALRRVTGITLVGGKNIYVRGLGERYSNIEMNSLPLPSPDPLKRSVPLDIFPAGAIQSMKVQKSGSADIPASFGGGYIDIRTKEVAKEDYIKLSIGAKANTNTGTNVYSYQGGGSDYLGFDDGYREIDPSILNATQVTVGEPIQDFTTNDFTKAELSEFTQKYVNRNYDVTQEAQPFGFDFGLEANKNIELADKHTLSVFASYNYETESSSRTEQYSAYDMQKSTGELYVKPTQYGTIDQSVTEYIHNAMINVGYNYADVFDLKYTKLYTKNSQSVTKVADGIMGSNDEYYTKYYLEWQERTLDVDQINAKFNYAFFGHEANFRFGLEDAMAHLYQPNNYQYSFRTENAEPFLDNKISNNIANKLDSTDDLTALYLKNKFHFELLSNEDYIDIGYSQSAKERGSEQNKYFLRKVAGSAIVPDTDMTGNIEGIYDEYVRPDIAYDSRSLMVGTLFKPADSYNAKADESNIYLNSFLKPFENFEILVGARYVQYKQDVEQFYLDNDNNVASSIESLSIDKVYPSGGLKLKLDKNNIIDFAFSQTYIVPDFREFTNGEYFHPYEVATIVGNPDLVNTDILSYDLKYAHYFSDRDAIKIGAFYKYLDKPIEDVMKPSSSLPIYSFDNADFATLVGIEIDGRKNFDFVASMVENFYMSGNFSYTQSNVTLREEQESVYSTNNRQLQGLSPMVINATFGYEKIGRSLTLSYNQMSERIRKLGMIDDGDYFPDHYENPAAILDFVWIETFEDSLSFKVKVGNILQGETIWTQGGRVTKVFTNPMTYSASMSYKW